jgi:D-3-phosphoglycerate dehydrogenase / 2-oxoglutarate reductase
MDQPTILVAERAFSPRALEVLAEAGRVVEFDEFARQLAQADAIVAGLEVTFDAETLARAPRLRVIASRTTQLRHIDLEEAARRGIEVLSIEADDPVLQETSSTAEEAFALLLALARRLPWAFDSVKRGEWERARYGGVELRGKTLGIVGFGRLGRMVAAYAEAFGLRVLFHDPYVDGGVELDELLRESDAVSIHCTYSRETEGLIGAAELAALRPGALFVNTARGEITDESALLDALEQGRLGGAAVDTLAGELPDGSHVRENPLVAYAREHENLIVLPHLGGATREATERTQIYIAQRLVEHLGERG